MNSLRLHVRDTPLGKIIVVTDAAERVRAVDFSDYESRMRRLLRVHYGAVELQAAEISPGLACAFDRYFEGVHGALDVIECETNGTVFQQRVWQSLRRIPAGTTSTYGALARSFGLPNGARAVGFANGSNPIAIIVPCHRLVGVDGALTGYAGGLYRKHWLLKHEGATTFRV